MTQEKKGPKFGMHPIGLSGASGRRPRKNPSRTGSDRPKGWWEVAAVPGGGVEVKAIKTQAPRRGWARTYR